MQVNQVSRHEEVVVDHIGKGGTLLIDWDLHVLTDIQKPPGIVAVRLSDGRTTIVPFGSKVERPQHVEITWS